MDIRDNRDRYARIPQGKNHIRRLRSRYRYAHNIAARSLQRPDLRHGCGMIIGVGVGHRLNGYGRIAADDAVSHPQRRGPSSDLVIVHVVSSKQRDNILEHHGRHQGEHDNQTHEIDNPLHLRLCLFAANQFDHVQQNVPAVQRRNRQQVHDAEVD